MSEEYGGKRSIFSNLPLFTRKIAIFLGCILVPLLSAQGAVTVNPVPVNITGTVIATASCTFGSDKLIQIEFGDVFINQISGDYYKKAVDYSLSCKGDADGKTIKMEWIGEAASFDSTLLTTDVNGLGIKLLQDSQKVSPNTWFTINAASPPALDVVLVKNSGAKFSNGQEFNASATLKVDYL
ncbi:fimbrial protein [uncultured Pantoea sp.]|uniref:fimbrial protein n=1 Tax=uncultured Pantoea sp. TaxID=218084 RepID=UPI0025DA1811|nr:fimbrial protein [uncultured Pantoea sp.]